MADVFRPIRHAFVNIGSKKNSDGLHARPGRQKVELAKSSKMDQRRLPYAKNVKPRPMQSFVVKKVPPVKDKGRFAHIPVYRAVVEPCIGFPFRQDGDGIAARCGVVRIGFIGDPFGVFQVYLAFASACGSVMTTSALSSTSLFAI